MTRETRTAMSILLCLQLLAPAAPAAAANGAHHCKKDPQADCKETTGPVTLEIGQPRGCRTERFDCRQKLVET